MGALILLEDLILILKIKFPIVKEFVVLIVGFTFCIVGFLLNNLLIYFPLQPLTQKLFIQIILVKMELKLEWPTIKIILVVKMVILPIPIRLVNTLFEMERRNKPFTLEAMHYHNKPVL